MHASLDKKNYHFQTKLKSCVVTLCIEQCYSTLKGLNETLKDHITLDNEHQTLLKYVQTQMIKLEAEVTEEIEDEKNLDLTLLGELFDIWPLWKRFCPQEDVVDIQNSIEKKCQTMLDRIIEDVRRKVQIPDTLMPQEDRRVIAQKLVKGYAISIIIQTKKSEDWLPKYKAKMQRALTQTDAACFIIGESLALIATESLPLPLISKKSPYAQAILDSFPVFKNFSVALFNLKASVK